MIKLMTCIECPQGCRLAVETGGSRFLSVTGHNCPRGETYARQETEAPMRTLTATVLTSGLEVRMLPVRTSKPIPKSRLPEAMEAVKRIVITSPVNTGAVIAGNFLGLDADLVATRELRMLKSIAAIVFLSVFAAGVSAHAQTGGAIAPARGQWNTEKRLGRVEKRIGKVEKRVTALERGGAPSAADGREDAGTQPVGVALVSKKQAVGRGEIGIRLVLEFKNLLSYTIQGFSGTLVFRPEGGSVYLRRISYAHPIPSGDTAQIELTINSDQIKQYLRFVKARTLQVVLTNQQLHE